MTKIAPIPRVDTDPSTWGSRDIAQYTRTPEALQEWSSGPWKHPTPKRTPLGMVHLSVIGIATLIATFLAALIFGVE